MNKYALSDFEYQISSTTRAAAQEFVSSGKVHSLREVERHFWVSKVRDEEYEFETEVIITPGKIKAYACECWSEPRKLMCSHIAASLLFLRKFLNQSTAEKERRAQEKSANQPETTRFTIHKILPEVPVEVLQDFIRDYARRDRDFALAFKTRFADMLTGSGNAYSTLLESVLPKNKAQMKEVDFKRIRKVMYDLDNRLEAAQNEGDHTIAFKITGAIVQTLAPVANTNPEPAKSRLCDICQAYCSQLMQVYQSDAVSPELRDMVWDFFLQMVKGQIFPEALHREVNVFMAECAQRDASRFDQIAKTYLEDEQPENLHLLYLYILTLAQVGKTENVVSIFRTVITPAGKNSEVTPNMRNILLELYYFKTYPSAAAVLDFIFEHCQLTPLRKSEFEKLRFHIAEITGDISAQIQYLQGIFVHFGRTETIDQIKQISGKNWPKGYQHLLAFTQKNGSPARIAQLLAYQGEQEVLALWLEQQLDIDLCIDYANYLSDTDLVRLMVAPFSSHLAAHFGRPGSEFVRDRLAILLRQKRQVVVKQIISILTKGFPERSGLFEAMNEIYERRVL
jgi:hypothetical protein